ncbi:glycosyltransferase family 2 protein [Spirosoma pollinicola]|uniref:dTDP-Rha--alpha-D-GlcNAc-pyrophosphate polyprenol alpha-3-L-rhamnosyltransferase n=1 Tax=Spirosoma pollinicola TaxID=2057025 RepID=A0A2K8Z3P3_9BACT|nr:glycosyltransferase family 2 protein [Spirosoma pollinicola]AUD04482.1 dTDP-Rha--alpha-D-GlcNAc-pyrophosphate polyprenol alpha-3-L-rhamnosyltransferase [Spirosoma pollinicola]
MDTLAIVILNYNGQPFLAKFLPAVLANADGHPVYVADSASVDSSVSFLRATFPTVRIIELPRNEGYAGGYNLALEHIRTHYGGARYYVLPNSDIAVTPGWLSPVLAMMETNPKIAACQPKIRSYDQPALFEHAGAAGGFVDWLGYVFCRGRVFATFEEDRGQYDDNRQVFWATGACLFMRAEVFHETGGFDGSFFAHMEEIDWCWRIQRLGYEVWACGQSTVYHVGGGTLHKSNPHKTYLNYRNSLFMLYKNWPADFWLWPKIMFRLILDGLSAILFLKVGQWRDVWAIIRAHFAFYGRLPQLHRERKRLKAQQTTEVPLYPDSIVWKYFAEGKKTFGEIM